MDHSFLLIGDLQDASFHHKLERALAPFGHLEIAAAGQKDIPQSDLVIVDASVVPDYPAVINRYLQEVPRARIIVATSVPTWRRAREAYRSGAMDYVQKSMSHEDLQNFFFNFFNTH